MLVPLDECDVLVVVDNATELLSTTPSNVTGELQNVLRAGARELAGHCLCCAQWGLSLLVTARAGGSEHAVLFDSGPEGSCFARNGKALGVPFGKIDEAVFSHGHWDHVGGMTTALELIRADNGGRHIPVHANAGMFVQRAMRTPRGGYLPFTDVPSPDQIEKAGGKLVLEDGARPLGGGLFHLSGEIPRTTSYEKGLPGHVRRGADGGWLDDALILDERFLAVHVRGKGIIVFSACSHAGIVNVLRHAREIFAPVPLYGVMGGFHLSGAACEPIIPETVADLGGFGLEMLVPGHCTGWRAIYRLIEAFGEERVIPSAVGRRHLFSGT
ncbi:MAG: MBL fold metallo-hydrolase [Hyphomicrobiales bacterium]